MDPILKVSEISEIYDALAKWAETCINQDDIINAQKCKLRISQLMLRMISEGYTRPKLRLYGKFNRLEIKLSRYILVQLRADYVELESPNEDEQD